MAKSGIITIDIGTTSMRAILYSENGRQEAMARRDNQPVYYPDGRVEQSAGTWKSILEQVLSESARAASLGGMKVEGISLTSQRSSVIPVDREGLPLHPALMWQDLRTEAMCRELSAYTAAVYAVCGMRITPVMSAVKIKWFREAMPEIFGKTWKMAGIHDFVLHLLTGKFLTDHSLASRTNLLNLEKLDWDSGLMELFGVPRSMLCDLVPPGSVAGGLLPGLAAITGLAAGLPVVTAGGDQQCAALGLGLTAPGRIVANTGTGSYLLAHSDRPIFDPEMSVFCNASALPGAYVVEASLPASGVIYRWFAETFYQGRRETGRMAGSADSSGSPAACGDYSDVNAEAESSPPGANGLIFLPHFKGSVAPHFNPNAKGTFHNLDLGTTRGDMVRAVLEGIVAEMAENLQLLENLTGKVDRVNVSGGLTQFELFNHMQADMYERKIRLAGQFEATALGAWISASVRLGMHRSPDEAAAAAATEAGSQVRELMPDPAAAAIYGKIRIARQKLYSSLYMSV